MKVTCPCIRHQKFVQSSCRPLGKAYLIITELEAKDWCSLCKEFVVFLTLVSTRSIFLEFLEANFVCSFHIGNINEYWNRISCFIWKEIKGRPNELHVVLCNLKLYFYHKSVSTLGIMYIQLVCQSWIYFAKKIMPYQDSIWQRKVFSKI